MVRKSITWLIMIAMMPMLVSCDQKIPAESVGSEVMPWQEQYDLGVRYLSEGNYEEAIIAFTAAIEIDPKQAEAYLGAADAYLGLNDAENAISILRRGLEELGDDQKIKDRLSELEGTGEGEGEPKSETEETPTAKEETPIVALMREGDSGGLLRYEEINFYGYTFGKLNLALAEQAMAQNGFNIEPHESTATYIWGSTHISPGDFYDGPSIGVQAGFNQKGLIDYIHYSAGYGEYDAPLETGFRGINLKDSLETVLSKIGFTNAGDLEQMVNALYQENTQAAEEEERVYYYDNEGCTVGYFGFTSNDELCFSAGLESKHFLELKREKMAENEGGTIILEQDPKDYIQVVFRFVENKLTSMDISCVVG